MLGERKDLSQSHAAFYPTLSKQSEKIVEYYKTQSEKESKQCLDESYDSMKSCSGHGSDDGECDRPYDKREGTYEYNTARTFESADKRYEKTDGVCSPDQYSTGNILEQIDNESHSVSTANRAVQNQISAIEAKSQHFKEVMKQYVDK